MAVKGGLFLLIENYSIYLSLAITALTAAIMGIFYKRCIRNAVNRYTAQLPNSPQQLNALINSLNDIIFEFDENKTCLNAWFNEFTERPIDPRQLVGKHLEDILGEERALKFNTALDYVIANRKPISIEYLSDHGTGNWLMAKLTPVFDREGKYTHRISASIVDISQQKNYAGALKEKERLLLEAQTVAKIGNWLFDSITRETYLSANLLTILGTTHIPDILKNLNII
jgi:two-component system sensor histidine kinase/response regulator